MTDKEQIIIDGVDVKNCRRRIGKNNYCRYFKRLCSENNFNCVWKQLARKTQECEELKIKLIQKDEVNTFFNTPIEGWDNDPCKICESKNNYEQLKEDYAELERECERLKSYGATLLADKNAMEIGRDDYIQRCKQLEKECDIWKNQVLIIDEEAVTVEVTQKQFEEYLKLKQECEKLSILAQEESARNAYIEYELNDKLKQKTQEYENLKAEEKYLKQCCEKAGEELAKHSFDYDGKEKNLVVQAMELNEKYEKLEKALEEIEEYIYTDCEYNDGCDRNICIRCDYSNVHDKRILDIINKAKDGKNEQL